MEPVFITVIVVLAMLALAKDLPFSPPGGISWFSQTTADEVYTFQIKWESIKDGEAGPNKWACYYAEFRQIDSDTGQAVEWDPAEDLEIPFWARKAFYQWIKSTKMKGWISGQFMRLVERRASDGKEINVAVFEDG